MWTTESEVGKGSRMGDVAEELNIWWRSKPATVVTGNSDWWTAGELFDCLID